MINENTKAIIPVDLAGIPCDYDKIFEIVSKKQYLFSPSNEIQNAFNRVLIIADSAHAFGAHYKNKMIGNVADFSTFSFHAVKNFTTSEGGALTWKYNEKIDNEKLYKEFQLYSLHGQNKDALAKNRLGDWEYDIVNPGYKCNMTDIIAAIGLAQFKRYPSLLHRRREIVERYNRIFKDTKVRPLKHFSNNYLSSMHLYIIHIDDISEKQRNEIIEKMANCGIACNVHYKPLPMLTAYSNMGFDISNYPNSISYFNNTITLPLHTKLTNTDVDFIANSLIEIINTYH